MKARSVVIGGLLAGAMLAGGQVVASANISWCVDDPPAEVQTSSGTYLTVNTQVYVPQSQVRFLNSVVESTATAPDGDGGTRITVTVGLPSGITTARIVSTVNRYGESASAVGEGGTTVTLVLDVPTD